VYTYFSSDRTDLILQTLAAAMSRKTSENTIEEKNIRRISEYGMRIHTLGGYIIQVRIIVF